MSVMMLYCAFETVEAAEAAAQSLVEERLVACANIFPGVRSVFRWEGKVQTASEAVMIAKTQAGLLGKAEARLAALHGYEVPGIVSWPVTGGHPDYLKWILNEVSE